MGAPNPLFYRLFGSPQMWVWPQLVFGGSPPIPHCNWRTLPSSQSPSLPALSLPLPPTPLGSFCNAPGVRDGAAQCGVGGWGPRGVEGEGPPAALGAGPTSGGTRTFLGRAHFGIRPVTLTLWDTPVLCTPPLTLSQVQRVKSADLGVGGGKMILRAHYNL